MTSHATQSSIQMSAPGVLGRAASGKGFSKILTAAEIRAAAGLATTDSPSFVAISQTGTGAMTLPRGTTAERPTGSVSAMRWNTTTSRHEFWTGAAWDNHVRLSGDTMTGALSLGANALTCGAITALSVINTSGLTIGGHGTRRLLMDSDGSSYFDSTASGIRLRFNGSNRVVVGSVTQITNGLSIVDASEAAGGALTCGAITSSGNLILRNGLTPMQADIFGTISGTSWESLCLKATATAHQIGSTVGTGGGTNRPVQLGHFSSAGAFTESLTISPTGLATFASSVGLGGTPNSAVAFHSQSTLTRQFLFNRVEIGVATTDGTYFSCGGSGEFTILNQENSTFRIGTNNAIVMTLSGVTTLFAGQLTHVPPSSVTLTTNNQFSIEMTSNTAGNLVYRGSDGTTRRMALTFV